MDGVIQQPMVSVDYPLKTANIDRWGLSYFWLDDIPYAELYPADIFGPMTDLSPIDVVSWSGAGVESSDLLSPWRRCLLMLTRL